MKLNQITETHPLTKLKQVMKHVRDPGKGVMITSPENPMGEKTDQKTNKDRLEKAKRVLRNKRYWVQKGVFEGEPERSLVIVDVSPGWAEKFADMFDQQSFIHLVPDGDKMNADYWEVEQEDEDGRTYEITNTTHNLIELPGGTDDDYSEIKGRKYNFPFDFS